MPDLDPAAIIGVLNYCGVRFVVIGGIAAQLHDLAVPATIDIDVTPARDNKNLQRLAKAFDELEAGLATANDAAEIQEVASPRGRTQTSQTRKPNTNAPS